MNSNFDSRNKSMQPSPDSFSQLDALQRDRFELLSAYLDGEVTATERKQVEEWLATDASMQKLHNRLMKLRQGFRALPTPAPSQPVEQTVEQVFAKVERRPNLRLVWGGSAIAAMFVGAVTVLSLNRSAPPQVAVDPKPKPEVTAEQPYDTDGLMIALDQQVVPMVKNKSSHQKSPHQTPRNAQ